MEGPCVNCSCSSFVPNQFHPTKCATCLHSHQKTNSSTLNVTAASSSTPTPDPATPSHPLPLPPTHTPHTVSSTLPSSRVTTTKKHKPVPPIPSSRSAMSFSVSPLLSPTSSQDATTLPKSSSISSLNLSPSTPTTPTSASTPQSPAVSACPSNPPSAKLVKENSLPNLSNYNKPAPSSGSKKSNIFGTLRDKARNARNVLSTSTFGKPSDGSETNTGTPVQVKHETHATSPATDKLQARNLPPELQWLFLELDKSLKDMGAESITQDEYLFLANTLLTSPGMLENKRANHITPGRAFRKTPQVFLEAQMEFEAQEPEVPKELKIGSRGVSTPPAQEVSTPKKAGPAPGQAQQNWALQNRILDLEKQLARVQAHTVRREEEGQRLAELNLATSVESREILLRMQRLEADLKRATDTLANRESNVKSLEVKNRNLETSLEVAEKERTQWESGYKKLELEARRWEAESKCASAQAHTFREKLDAESSARASLEKQSRHAEHETKDLATQLDEVGKDKLQFKETIDKLEQEIKGLEKMRKDEKETYASNLASLETKLNSQIESLRKQKDQEEKQRVEAQGLAAELQHQLKRIALQKEQDKTTQVTEHEALQRMKESFEQELRESKAKAASELEVLSKKGASELSEMTKKYSEEAALRASADKTISQLDSDVRELTTKLATAAKSLMREEELRTRLSVDLKSAAASMEKAMATKESQLSSELESLRKKVEQDTQAKLSLENDIASKQLQMNELSTSTSKQLQTLTQKLDDQAQHAARLAKEIEERKRAQEDAAHENAEYELRMRSLTEEKSLNIQTMAEVMKENEELEADIAELRARIERMSEDAHASAEEVASVPATVPEPPTLPTAPMLSPTQAQKVDNADFQAGLAVAAGNLKKAPAPSPKPKDARQEMLQAIQSQNITLKAVRKSMIANKPGDKESANNIVGILARALIRRRKDVSEDATEEDWE